MLRRALPVLAATLLVACGGGEDPAASPADTPVSIAPVATNGSDATPGALQLSAPLVGGGEIELGDLAGRPVLLWFWAPW